jgi:hypothetical protein
MINSRFFRETKSSNFFRKKKDRMFKFERKFKIKVNKNKKSASRNLLEVDSSDVRDFLVSKIKNLSSRIVVDLSSRIVVDSSITQIFIVTFNDVSIDSIFDDLDRDDLLRMLTTLINIFVFVNSFVDFFLFLFLFLFSFSFLFRFSFSFLI